MLNRITPYAILVGRVVLGIVFIAHGWQKLTEGGLSGTAQGFEAMGIPLPTVSAAFIIFVELVGGAALIVGALLPVFGVLIALNMLGAIYFVHGENGFYNMGGGYEYVLSLAAFAIAIGFSGGGALAVDSLIPGLRASSGKNAGAQAGAAA